MTSEILRFRPSEKPVIDESIQEYEYHEYEPQARTNLNSAGEINIKHRAARLVHSSGRELYSFRRQTNENRRCGLRERRCCC